MFLASLAVGNYNFKSNQPSGGSSVEVTQLLEMANASGCNLAGTFFTQIRVLVLFQTIVHLFIFVGLVHIARLFSSHSAFLQVALTPILETTKPGSLIAVET